MQKKSESQNESKNVPEFDIEFPKTEFKVEKTEQRDPSLNVMVTNLILQGEDNNNPFMYFVAYNQMPEKLKTMLEKDPDSQTTSFQGMLMVQQRN